MEEKQFHIMLSNELKKAFWKIAIDKGSTMSDITRELIKKYVEDNRDG